MYLTLANVAKKVHNHVLSHTDSDALLRHALLGQCASRIVAEAHVAEAACRRISTLHTTEELLGGHQLNILPNWVVIAENINI